MASVDQAIRLNPISAQAHFNRGSIFQLLDKPELALACLENATRFMPNYADAHFQMGLTLQQLQRQVASRQIDQRKAKQELDRIKANKAYLEKELADINARVDGYQEIIEKERASGVNTRRLQTELVQLSRTRDSMKRELDAAYALSSSIKVEG